MTTIDRRAFGQFALALCAASAVALPRRAGAAVDEDGLSAMQSDGRFNRWTYLVQESGLAPYAAGRRPYTVFAPTDQAMAQYPNVLDRVLGQNRAPSMQVPFPDMGRLVAVIRRHVVAGLHPASALNGRRTTLTSLAGPAIVVDFSNPRSRTVVWDFQSTGTGTGTGVGEPLEAANAVIYPINNVDLRSFG